MAVPAVTRRSWELPVVPEALEVTVEPRVTAAPVVQVGWVDQRGLPRRRERTRVTRDIPDTPVVSVVPAVAEVPEDRFAAMAVPEASVEREDSEARAVTVRTAQTRRWPEVPDRMAATAGQVAPVALVERADLEVPR